MKTSRDRVREPSSTPKKLVVVVPFRIAKRIRVADQLIDQLVPNAKGPKEEDALAPVATHESQ